jgi:invasion protein IalB
MTDRVRFTLKLLGLAGTVAVASALVASFVAPGNAATTSESAQPTSTSGTAAAPPVMALAQADQAASTLPGGASALSETYRDWQVACSQQEAAKHCSLSQSQIQQNGQRVLAIELAAPSENAVSGIIVLPFGLALASGATLQIDDKAAGQPLPFRTCLPVGCIVPVTFDADTIAILRAGAALKIMATSDGGQQTPFAVSLAGFAAALDRVAALAG